MHGFDPILYRYYPEWKPSNAPFNSIKFSNRTVVRLLETSVANLSKHILK